MENWSVSPSDGVTNQGGGVFIFPTNSGTTAKEYVVTYTDDNNCSGSYTYKVLSGSSCQESTCDLAFLGAPTGITMSTVGAKSFTVRSYEGSMNVQSDARTPTVTLSDGSTSDDYITVGTVTASTSPYGFFEVGYTVRRLPTSSDYNTSFKLTNSCGGDITVPIVLKKSSSLTPSIYQSKCSTLFTFSGAEGSITSATISDNTDPTGGNGEIIVSQTGTTVEAISWYFYKVDNSSPATMTATLTSVDENGNTYVNSLSAPSKWLFDVHCEGRFTTAPNMAPTSSNPTTAFIILDFCNAEDTGTTWQGYVDELRNSIPSTGVIPIVWTYTYWTSETTTASTAFTTTVSMSSIKAAISSSYSIAGATLATISTPSNHVLPNAYWGNGQVSKTYCLDLKIVLSALPNTLTRQSDYVFNFSAGNSSSACE